MHLGACDCLGVVCVHMCFCMCAHVPYSPLSHRVPWGMGQRISTSVRNLGPLPQGESPIAAAAEYSDNLSGQTWGRQTPAESSGLGVQDVLFQQAVGSTAQCLGAVCSCPSCHIWTDGKAFVTPASISPNTSAQSGLERRQAHGAPLSLQGFRNLN